VTQATLTSTICRKGGYTSGIRPSAYVTGREKRLNAASYGNTNLWVEPADPGHRSGSVMALFESRHARSRGSANLLS